MKKKVLKGLLFCGIIHISIKKRALDTAGLIKKIKAFEKENKGVYIDFKPISRERGLVEIETAAKLNALPDIAPVGGNIEIQQLELLEPLDDYISDNRLNGYLDGVVDTVTYNKHIYGIPKLIDLHIMILNRYELETVGTSVPQKITMPEIDFLDLAEQLYQQTSKPLLVGKQPRLTMAWFANSPEKLQEIQTRSGMIYKEGIEKELEKQNISIAAFATMDLVEFNYRRGGELEYKWMNLYADEKNIYGECLAYGIFQQDDEKKLQMCLKFINFLTNNEEQTKLSQYNAFPVKKLAGAVYTDESDMAQLEKLLKRANKRFTNTLREEQKSDFINMYPSNDEHQKTY